MKSSSPPKGSSQSSSPPSSASAPSSTPSSSSRLNPLSSDPTTKMVPYSSIVKKTSGGPSGSLTSEGTEYDSSGEEEAEANGSAVSAAPHPTEVINKIPAVVQPSQPKSHQHPQQVFSLEKSNKQSLVQKEVEVSATAVVEKLSSPSESGGCASPQQSSTVIVMQEQQQDSFLPQHSAGVITRKTLPIYSSREVERSTSGRESPYLERKVQRDNSLDQEAWPLIHVEHPHLSNDRVDSSPFVPPQNTVLFAAAMTNKNLKDQNPLPLPPVISSPPLGTLPSHSKSMSSLPFSSIPLSSSAGRGGYTDMFSIQTVTRPAITHPPPPLAQTQPRSPEGGGTAMPPYLPHSRPQAQATKKFVPSSSTSSLVLDSVKTLLDESHLYHSPSSCGLSTRTALHGQHQYHSSGVSPLFVPPSSDTASSSVYSSSESCHHLNNIRPVPPPYNFKPVHLPYSNPGEITGGMAHHQGYSPYNSSSQMPRTLGYNTISSTSNIASATNVHHFSMMVTNPGNKMIPGTYEAQSAKTPMYVNGNSSLSIPSERSKGPHVSMTTSSSNMGPVASSAVVCSHVANNVVIPPRPAVLAGAVVDAVSQTDHSGAPKTENMGTQTSDVFVLMEDLCPPCLPLDSLGM